MAQFEQVAEAFTRKADQYDQFGVGHENLTRMRHKVYDHISQLTPSGAHLLELNAGTGLDAVEMVQRGYRVHATDISPGMVTAIETKIADHDLGDQLTVQRCSFTDLDQVKAGPFDAIYSNSGGLNCIAELTAVTRHLPRLLKPGGIVTVVIMPRICLWELALLGKDWRVATRRLRRNGIVANVEGVSFRTYYFTASQVRRAFGSAFKMVRLEALSLITPTADNDRFAVNHPRLFRFLCRYDDHLSQWPILRGWGDFFVLSMKFLP